MNVCIILAFLLLLIRSQVEAKQVSLRLHTEKSSKRLSPTRRRPDPDDLIVDDLIEAEDEMYDPLPSDINMMSLRKQMGWNFTSNYMSINDPSSRPNNPDFSSDRPKGVMPNYLHLTRNARPQDGKKLRLNVTKENRKKIQNFLWNWSFCPVKHSWKLMNVRFWPRWIKVGSCYNQGSCSFPPGMTCQPHAGEFLYILRWRCRDYRHRVGCEWITVSYSVLTECTCSCGAESEKMAPRFS